MNTKDVTKDIKESPENIGVTKEKVTKKEQDKATIKASEKTEIKANEKAEIKTREKAEQENCKVQASEKTKQENCKVRANEKAEQDKGKERAREKVGQVKGAMKVSEKAEQDKGKERAREKVEQDKGTMKVSEKAEQDKGMMKVSEKAEQDKGAMKVSEKVGVKANKKIGITTKKITYVALATAVTIVLSLIAIPLPFTPIPFTMSVFAIFLVSSLLPPSMAVLAQVVYIFIGIIGIPVFSKFTGGFSALIGPTGGFLMAYPIMAFVIAIFAKKKKVIFAIIGMALALGICYLIGGFWLNFVTKMGIAKAMAVGVVPYIIPDLVKLVLATIIVKTPYVKRISLN